MLEYSKHDTSENRLPSDHNDIQYRLRHLNTGRLVIDQDIVLGGCKIKTLGLSPHLSIKDVHRLSEKPLAGHEKLLAEIDSDPKNFEIAESGNSAPIDLVELDQRSRFKITSTSPSLDQRIKQNSCVQIMHVATEMYLSFG